MVTSTTPLAARAPYTAADAPSLSTEIFSTSLASSDSKASWLRTTPSITYNGDESLVVPLARMLSVLPAPGLPVVEEIITPERRPASDEARLPPGMSEMAFASMLVTLPVTLPFFWVP